MYTKEDARARAIGGPSARSSKKRRHANTTANRMKKYKPVRRCSLFFKKQSHSYC